MGEISQIDLLFASASSSVRFAQLCLEPYRDQMRATSSFVTQSREIAHWHEFGDLEGPGWSANAIGGAHLLHQWGQYCSDDVLVSNAKSLLKHVLYHGFIDPETGVIMPYYDLGKSEYCWNYVHGMDWLCPGSLAKIGVQLLDFSEDIHDESLSREMIHAAERLAAWIKDHTAFLNNGWLPRRITPEGDAYPYTPEGNSDSIFDHSGDGLFILQLWALLADRGMSEYASSAEKLCQSFLDAGGHFGSINHDTYDDHESVAYACAFRILRQAGEIFGDRQWMQFAFEKVLPGLARFQMEDDRHGLPTLGLIWMEESWNTAYLWENAEASQAFLEAWEETGDEKYLGAGIAILQAAALHHHGEFGFLTEGVDWDNHVGCRHHISGEYYEDIRYTEPLLNNLHIVLPTLTYFKLAKINPLIMEPQQAINLVSKKSLDARKATNKHLKATEELLTGLQPVGVNITHRDMGESDGELEAALQAAGYPVGRPMGVEIGRNGPFCLQGNVIDVFSDYDLSWFFREGVVLDAGAVDTLIRRGWGEKLGIINKSQLSKKLTMQVINQTMAGVKKIDQIKGEKLIFSDMNQYAWDFDLEHVEVKVFSEWLNEHGESAGYAVVGLVKHEMVYSQSFVQRFLLLPVENMSDLPIETFEKHRTFWTDVFEWAADRVFQCKVLQGEKTVMHVFSNSDQSEFGFTVINSSTRRQEVKVGFSDICGSESQQSWHIYQDGRWKLLKIPGNIFSMELKPGETNTLKCQCRKQEFHPRVDE